ncbi:integrase, bacteriophage P4-type [Geobacter metallireducens GS-15]|uniref:Integrase, bacteriophage P4-type n=1 Tax=Geobacter metallireducens (strain ATCC 53774 / DSM 7210 / GS-15) TaxID=269799 RepID=Q39TC0_GEOMG|nr:site-specific integrase [Geobacter metallireducens]ABB32504.1 integrase, bacteriophage P4-type [Geobacter metallireducens GS-15]
MSTQFSDKFIQNLKPEAKKYYIRESRGFAIVVHPSGIKNPKGTKTFLYIYTINGKRKELKLGNYPEVTLKDARIKHGEAYARLVNGEDPVTPPVIKAEPQDENLTFGHFTELYLQWSKDNHSPKWHNTIKCALNKDALPVWEYTLIASIKRRDAIAFLENVARRGIQVINLHKATSSVFDYALEREYIESNPMAGLKAKTIPALKPKARERFLSDSEIKHVWKAIDEGPGYDETKRALKLIMVTAQRPGEVAAMHRREIQTGVGKPRCKICKRCGWWTIPAERMKNGEEHRIYLTPTALELIGDAEGYIFPSPQDGQPINRNSLSQLVSRERNNKKPNGEMYPPYYGLPEWTPHDLRRTARTLLARVGVPEEHAEEVLSHKKEGLVDRYNRHDYMEEKKEALIKLEAELMKLSI